MCQAPNAGVPRLTFDNICALLPTAQQLPVATPRPTELDPLNEQPFVEPTIKEILRVGRPAVILIAARGAVGKTTLGREIARRTGTHLWALGLVQVGHRYLEGALAAAYGDQNFSTVATELSHGKRAVVLDGLDEALLRAGDANFDAFLDSLARRFKTVGESPSLVLLGRTLAAERVWDYLIGKGVQVSFYEIDYFDRPSAELFLETYLERGMNRPHIINRRAFQHARDAVLDRLRDAVPAGLEPGSVIGYAPVLRLVAELLDVRNPHAIAQQADTWSTDELLRKVAEGILEREREEKVNQVPVFRGTGAWAPDEQCLRLLARRADHVLEAHLPCGLAGHLREEYERRVSVWINEHPFVREQVFEEYVLAWLFVQPNIVEPSLAEAVRDRLRAEDPPYRPTPLLLRFASDLGQGMVSIAAADFGFVYESAMADSASNLRERGQVPRVTLTSSRINEEVMGEIVFPTLDNDSNHRVNLHLKDAERGLWFWRNLARANISVMADVQIGAGGFDFALGPDVDLECLAFTCNAEVVRVNALNDEEQVVIQAESYRSKVAPRIVSYNANPCLKVAWDSLRHPWVHYRLDEVRGEATGMRGAFIRLRRLLNPFRATVHFNQLSCPAALMDRIAGFGLARDMLIFCERMNLIRRVGNVYLLNRNVLDRNGINWVDLGGRQVSCGIADFLNTFLDNFPVWRLSRR